MPLIHAVVVVHGLTSAQARLFVVGARRGQHVRVPDEVDVVRGHVEVLPVAARAHEAEEVVVALDGCREEEIVGEAWARHLPQKGALALRRRNNGLDEAGRGAGAWVTTGSGEEGRARVGTRPHAASLQFQ